MNSDIIKIYNEIEILRKEVKQNKNAVEYYNYLKNINKNDLMYGWIFKNDNILNDTLEDFDLYQNAYILSVLQVYKNELENILIKVNNL